MILRRRKGSFSRPSLGVPDTERIHGVTFRPILEALPPVPFIEPEGPELGAGRMPIRLNDRATAPLASVGKLKTSAHLKVAIPMQNVGATHIFGSVSRQVDETLQFIDRRQPPIRISCQLQLAAVANCFVPTSSFAAIFCCPHETVGRVDPVSARLGLLSHTWICL